MGAGIGRGLAGIGVAVLMGVAGAQAPAVQGGGPQQGGQQQTSAPPPTGTVTGRVMCTDTQRPARFAQVMLVRVPSADGTQSGDRRGGFGGGGGARTGLDGSFVAANVAPGDYYVMASAPGYVPERALVQAAVNAGADPNAIVARLPVVRVSADSSSAVTVQMERGGTIAGRVQWEDGSAASGVQVTAVSTATTVPLPAALQGLGGGGGGTSTVMTDDRGAFRVTGLPSGDYLLHATLRAPVAAPVGFGGGFGGGPGGFGGQGGFGTPITVYAPGVFHKAQAKPVTVRAGEERDDVRMVINLGSLRKVAGNVSSATAGQAVASGRVTLSDPSDTTVTLQGTIAANGDFSVAYVPPGTYTLQVNGSTQSMSSVTRGRGGRGGSSGASFQPLTQSVTVGETDVTGLGITLSPLQAAAPQ